MVGTLVALAAVALLVTALLAVPVRLLVRVERAERLRALLRVRWLFGLVDVQSGWPRPPRPPKPPKPAKPETAPAKKPKALRRARRALAVARTPGLMPRALRLLNDLRRQVRIEAFDLHAEVGFDDPADTGRLCGALAPVLAMASASGVTNVRWRPNFTRAELAGSAGATLRVRPLSVVAVVGGFVCSRPAARALWRLARRR
jgi:hypothetical protein